MLAGAGMAAVVSFHSACRLFSHHRWELDRLGPAIAALIVTRLLPADASITAAVDDTLFCPQHNPRLRTGLRRSRRPTAKVGMFG